MPETSAKPEAMAGHNGLTTVATGLRPGRLVPGVAAGVIGGILGVMWSISYATLIFSGPLASHLGEGIGLGLFSVAVLNLAAGLGSSLRSAVTSPQEQFTVIVAAMAASIAGLMGAGGQAHLFPTVLALIAVTTFSTGAFFLGLGVFRLGRLVRYVPFPVIGGFLAGTGWLISLGAFQVLTGIPLTRSNLHEFVGGSDLGHALAGIVAAAVLLVMLRRFTQALVLPALLLLFAAIVYAGLLATGTPPLRAETHGWLLGPLPGGGLYHPLAPSDFKLVDWSALAGQAGSILTVMVTSAVAFLLNIAGLEAATGEDLDLNRELRAMGTGNLLSGLGTGFTGYHSVSASLVARKIGSGSRLVGVVGAAVAGLVLLGGTAVLDYVPRVVVGGLLLYLGVTLLIEWVVRGWFTMPRLDYATVLVILAVIGVWGFLAGLVVGIGLGIVLFVIAYSRTGIIKYELSGRDYSSHVDRSEREEGVLAEQGDRLSILTLQGFLFFGTTSRLLDRIRELAATGRLAPHYIVLDCRLVTGADASMSLTMGRLGQMAARNGLLIVLTGLAPTLQQTLIRTGQVQPDAGVFRVFPDLDRGVEWCENQILDAAHALECDPPPAIEQLRGLLRSEDFAERLMPYLQRLEFPAGAQVIKQGAASDAVYLVQSGRLSVVLEQPDTSTVHLRTVSAGALVGEIGFQLGSPRSASVVATEPSVLYSLTRDALAELQARDPAVVLAFTRMIVRLLAERLTTANGTIAALTR